MVLCCRVRCTGRRHWDFLNFLLMILVVVPAALFLQRHLIKCPDLIDTKYPTNLNKNAASPYHLFGRWIYTFVFESNQFYSNPLLMERAACEIFLWHPIIFVHLTYFIFVDIGFYVVYLIQGSTWLIDPHWQLLPMCISIFYYVHPNANQNAEPPHLRATITLALLWLWGLRLLHNYFRRENWHFGEREDWRYNDMRQQHGSYWIITQFFAVSMAQHGMLVGLTLPLSEAMASNGSELNWLDGVAFALCIAGIGIGFVSDNQLTRYMNMKNKPMLLETGLWKYSRHPNHFGEQTWWIGLLLFGVSACASTHGGLLSWKTWWPIAFGVLFNHPLDTFVTLPLIEDRMLRRPKRVKVFQDYQKRTSLIFPMPQGASVTKVKKSD